MSRLALVGRHVGEGLQPLHGAARIADAWRALGAAAIVTPGLARVIGTEPAGLERVSAMGAVPVRHFATFGNADAQRFAAEAGLSSRCAAQSWSATWCASLLL